jgi:hypothetical protein
MSSLPPEILDLRKRAHSGGRIEQHRAFLRIADRKRISWTAVLLVIALTIAVILLLPFIAGVWKSGLQLVAPVTGFGNAVATQTRSVLPFIKIPVPYIAAVAPVPGFLLLVIAAVVTLVVFIGSWFVPRKLLPLIYILRLAAVIQAISTLYFALFRDRFPYTLARYTLDMHTVGLAILALVPVIFGLTYFVFDFGITRKLLIVVMTITHLIVFIPLQYLVHAALVNTFSLLFLPVLFMIFGVLLDVSILIAMYGWGMSWRDRAERIEAAGTNA